jgi:hypothetical protein
MSFCCKNTFKLEEAICENRLEEQLNSRAYEGYQRLPFCICKRNQDDVIEPLGSALNFPVLALVYHAEYTGMYNFWHAVVFHVELASSDTCNVQAGISESATDEPTPQ